MQRWLLVEGVPGPEPGVAGPLVSNPHVKFNRYVGVKRSDRCVVQPEVVATHPDLLKAVAKGCLKQLRGPVVAADAESAAAMLGMKPPQRKKADASKAGGKD